MELFKTVNYSGKNPHLKCLKVFSIRLWLISILLVFILIDVHEDWIGSPLMTKIFASHNFLILNTMSVPEQSDKNIKFCVQWQMHEALCTAIKKISFRITSRKRRLCLYSPLTHQISSN